MNILATLHPKDKDYGHMKIDEPKTPYTKYNEGHSDDEQDGLDADLLAKKIQLGGNELPKALVEPEVEEELSEEESAEEKEKRKIFEMKRKQHYNEYYAVKLARKLMEDDSEEDDDEAEEDESKESAGKDAVSTNDEREASMEEVVEDGKEISGSHSEEMAVNDEQEESGLRS
ncbi:protein phosphatase inhibitor 2-like isoform X2 [Portunus trituberculatus]|nr:protein phosphatase inhibitor 2-like isoform X2 [Portunus trituberculatus]